MKFGRPPKLNAHQRREAIERLRNGETQAEGADLWCRRDDNRPTGLRSGLKKARPGGWAKGSPRAGVSDFQRTLLIKTIEIAGTYVMTISVAKLMSTNGRTPR